MQISRLGKQRARIVPLRVLVALAAVLLLGAVPLACGTDGQTSRGDLCGHPCVNMSVEGSSCVLLDTCETACLLAGRGGMSCHDDAGCEAKIPKTYCHFCAARGRCEYLCDPNFACPIGQACNPTNFHCEAMPCQKSAECPTNYECRANACQRIVCKTDAECPSESACIENACHIPRASCQTCF